MAQMIEHSDPPEDVFRAMVENAAMSQGDLVNELCCDEVLSQVTIKQTSLLITIKFPKFPLSYLSCIGHCRNMRSC